MKVLFLPVRLMVWLLIYFVCFHVVLGVPIAIHELGHYVALKSCGVGVKDCQVGIGPSLRMFSIQETDFKVGLIPFGGFNLPYSSKEVEGTGATFRIYKEVSPIEDLWISSAGVLVNLLSVLVVVALFPFMNQQRKYFGYEFFLREEFRVLKIVALNIVLGLVSFGQLPRRTSDAYKIMWEGGLLRIWICISVFLFFFNLIPASSMDGTRVLNALCGIYGVEFPLETWMVCTTPPLLSYIIMCLVLRNLRDSRARSSYT